MSEQTTHEEARAEKAGRVRPERIVVAVDLSPHSVAALRAAAKMAALFGAELEGLFVEDINLIHLCGFPFRQEIGSFTAVSRSLDDRTLQRQLRAIAGAIEDAMEEVAGPAQVHWTFRVQRGGVVRTLLDAAQRASVLSLGRASVRRRRTLGSTAQSIIRQSSRPLFILGESGTLAAPLVLLYTGTEAANRALVLAMDLARRTDMALRVVVVSTKADGNRAAALEESVKESVAALDVDTQVETHLTAAQDPTALVHEIEMRDGTLIVPSDLADLLAAHGGPTIVVP